MKISLKYKLEVIVFLSGAVVMALELTGSRVIAPFLGTSLYVWTGLIGVIMGSLSLGYYWGGLIADKNISYQKLAKVLNYAGLSILVANILKGLILLPIVFSGLGVGLATIISGIAIFSVPSVLLGMVTPFAAKLKIKKLDNTGITIGGLYAISTLGSIFGTFITGFLLIAWLGTTNLLFILSATLLLLSLSSYFNEKSVSNIAILLFIGVSLIIGRKGSYFLGVLKEDVDTKYNRVLIVDYLRDNGKEVRSMIIGNQSASGMYLQSDDLAYEYESYYNLISHFKSDFKSTLMLGGGAYSYPKYYLRYFPQAIITVVEIDPALKELAKKHFNLVDNSRLEIVHEDARVFLNNNHKSYDSILVDVFNTSHSIPFHLTTLETVQGLSKSLVSDGVVAVNIISSIKGESSGFLNAEFNTYRKVFPQVFVFPVRTFDEYEVQNIVLIALKSPKKPTFESTDPELQGYLSRAIDYESANDRILTDDFAPVESFYKNLY